MRREFPTSLAAWLFVAVIGLCAAPMAEGAVISPGLEDYLQTLDDNEPVAVILIMSEQAPIAELNEALKIERASRASRHERVVRALKEVSITQADLLARLTADRTQGQVFGFTGHWIANLIVAQVTAAYVYELAEREDIAQIEANFTTSLIEPVSRGAGGGERGIGVTPGLRAINADQVWYELGITGAGTLIGGCDTGVDGNHPALSARWRGNNGHPAGECWLSLIGASPDYPSDSHGHGTHTMGTMAGLGASTQDTVGVAWNALWIATDAINQGVSPEFDNDVILAYEWFADPDGNPGTLDDVPDVIQNSWRVNEGFPGGYTDCDSRWWDVIDNCEAAGVVTCWSAGNEGPSGHTIGSPADRATTLYNCFSIGALDATNYNYPWPVASFSSRGPTGCPVSEERLIKPEISGPGVDVYSSVPGGGYQGGWSGTSMSGPHVAGVAALMREANPDLDVDTIKEIIMMTAVDLGAAGEDNDYGWGMIDAYQAVLAVMSGYGTLEGTITNALNGDSPVPGAVISVVELDRTTTSAADGTYRISVPADTYTVSVTHPSFMGATATNVIVIEDLTSILDFSLIDIGAPEISGTTQHRSTENTTGPYDTQATISDFSELAGADLYYRANGGAWTMLPMSGGAGDLYSAGIPGQPQVTHVEYYVRAEDIAENVSQDPPGAPEELYDFYVAPIEDLFSDDIESGAPDWEHSLVTPGFLDQWHLSTERNHTPGGTASWKCGDSGTGEYANLLDAGLVTPAIDLTIDSYLHYWQWIDAEESSAYPGRAYDGGLVEISVDGGPWEQISPDEGYTHTIRPGSTPGPFPEYTEVFSGSADWHPVNFNLGAYSGPAQLRFRFGSDGADVREGWHIDDVVVDGFVINTAAVTDNLVGQVRWRGADPNPFGGQTALRYDLPARSQVLLQVFDLSGRLVRTLVDQRQTAGAYRIEWDGSDHAAHPLPAGVYLTRLRAGAQSATGKVVLTR